MFYLTHIFNFIFDILLIIFNIIFTLLYYFEALEIALFALRCVVNCRCLSKGMFKLLYKYLRRLLTISFNFWTNGFNIPFYGYWSKSFSWQCIIHRVISNNHDVLQINYNKYWVIDTIMNTGILVQYGTYLRNRFT